MGIQQILLTTVGGGATITLQGYPNDFDPSIAISDTVTETAPFPAACAISIVLNADGTATYSDSSTGTLVTYNWRTGGSSADYYAFMDTPTSGAFNSGATNTNLQLNTTRAWQLTASRGTVGTTTNTVVSTLRIRNSSFTDLVTKAVDLSATATQDP